MQTESTIPSQLKSLLTSNPAYRRTRAFAELDRRSAGGYTRSGGLYRVDWSDYHETSAGTASFKRTDADLRQFIPVFRDNWIIALHALASTTSTALGQDVPFYLLPDLGGSHTLRGYQPWRFRDRSRLLLSAEYRWTAGSFSYGPLWTPAVPRPVWISRPDDVLRDRRPFPRRSAPVTHIELARTRKATA